MIRSRYYAVEFMEEVRLIAPCIDADRDRDLFCFFFGVETREHVVEADTRWQSKPESDNLLYRV